MNMDKTQIQEKTKKLFEKAGKPKVSTKELQGLLKSYVNKKAIKLNLLRPNSPKIF